MGARSWFRRGPRWDGRSGRPPSGNGASSFHLIWELAAGPFVEVRAELRVSIPPAVDRLHFWALDVGFAEPDGGGAHLGLQWYPPHPGSTAANWGGYAPQGGELRGGPLAVPSATGNANTGDFPWRAGAPYRLVVRRSDGDAPPGHVAWTGVVVDLEHGEELALRDLWSPGTRLVRPMVWSEVFAECDAPTSEVRWRALEAITESGAVVTARRVRVNYQRLDEGGCVTTDSSVAGDEFVQRTGTERRTRSASVLRLS